MGPEAFFASAQRVETRKMLGERGEMDLKKWNTRKAMPEEREVRRTRSAVERALQVEVPRSR